MFLFMEKSQRSVPMKRHASLTLRRAGSNLLFDSYFLNGRVANNRLQRLHQGRAGRTQFRAMEQGEPAQHIFSMSSQRHQHTPLILLIAVALNQVTLYHAVHQLNHTMMLDLEALRQVADCYFSLFLPPFQRQQELVLLRLKANRARGLFAKSEEVSQLIAKLGQGLVFTYAKITSLVQFHSRFYRITIQSYQREERPVKGRLIRQQQAIGHSLMLQSPSIHLEAFEHRTATLNEKLTLEKPRR